MRAAVSARLQVANDCNGINFGSAIVRGGVWLEALFLQVYALPDAKPPWFEEQAALVAAINEIPRVRSAGAGGGGQARLLL